MKLLLETMTRHFPRLNHKAYVWDDVEKIAKRHRINITIASYDPEILGYYCTRRTAKRIKKFIMVNSLLGITDRTFIGLHELGHFFLHVPVSSRQYFFCRRNAHLTESKQDCEANSFALIAMLPLWMLIEADGVNYADMDPGQVRMLHRRKQIWECWGV